MRLLKIIIVLFLIYFIRRFMQMYQVMKGIQAQHEANNLKAQRQEQAEKAENVVNAEYKVID